MTVHFPMTARTLEPASVSAAEGEGTRTGNEPAVKRRCRAINYQGVLDTNGF
jgi:hypothetical protein